MSPASLLCKSERLGKKEFARSTESADLKIYSSLDPVGKSRIVRHFEINFSPAMLASPPLMGIGWWGRFLVPKPRLGNTLARKAPA
jgi:hypothetical protein